MADVIRSLAERRVGGSRLAIVDGSAGLAEALREQWPTSAIQRCTAHKLRNLEAKAPVRLREELAEEYRRMIYAESRTLVDQARAQASLPGREAVPFPALWVAAQRSREAPEDRRLGRDGTH